MLSLVKLVTESLLPAQGAPRSRIDTDPYLRPLVLLVIILFVGPDVFAVAELTTLLDLLGATMFLIAFGVGYKFLGVAVLNWLSRLLVRSEHSMLISMRGRPSAVAFGLLLVAGNGLVILGLCFTSYEAMLELVMQVV